MKQTIVDDWHEVGTPVRLPAERPARSLEPLRRAVRGQTLKGRLRLRRSVFDVWRVLLVMAVVLLPLSAWADGWPAGELRQQEAVCLAESLSGPSAEALGSALTNGWEGAVRLLLSLMFVALIAFRLWRDE